MSTNTILAMAATVALLAPSALAQSRPSSIHAVGPDGAVYYADRSAGTVVRVNSDGTSDIVANQLDSPTGLKMDPEGYLLVYDEIGIHRLFLNRGTIRLIEARPTPFEPSVRFDQSAWSYRESKGKLTLVFDHNLNDLKPSFEIEVSRDGGLTWSRVASNLTRTSFTWTRPDENRDSSTWPLTSARFRVKAFVEGRLVASDVSDRFEQVSLARRGGQ